jgi:hypothetical protein
MPFDTKAIITEIDDILAVYDKTAKEHSKPIYIESDRKTVNYVELPEEVSAELRTLMGSAVKRLAPDPEYGRDAIKFAEESGYARNYVPRALSGVLKSLRSDYQAGRLRTLRERIASDVFSDFLEMAEYLIQDEGLKDPAAVVAGSVLEQHIKKLCAKKGVPTTFIDNKGDTRPKKLDTMNAELAKASTYDSNDQKQITAWAGIRNAAAHGEYDKYAAPQVALMIQGIRHFMTRVPA